MLDEDVMLAVGYGALSDATLRIENPELGMFIADDRRAVRSTFEPDAAIRSMDGTAGRGQRERKAHTVNACASRRTPTTAWPVIRRRARRRCWTLSVRVLVGMRRLCVRGVTELEAVHNGLNRLVNVDEDDDDVCAVGAGDDGAWSPVIDP